MSLWLMRDQLSLDQGILFYSWERSYTMSKCLIVPSDLHSKVLYFCHISKDPGHFGQQKTPDKLKEMFYCYGMSRDSDLYVKQCSVCNTNKKGNRAHRSGLECFQAGFPMVRVHIDILGPINPKTKSGSSNTLVIFDQFTKCVELAALPGQNAELTVIT